MSDELTHSLTEPAPLQESQGYLPRQLVLLGAGHAHLQVMTRLASHPLLGARITLIAPHAEQVYASMVPGFVAGHYTVEECTIPMEPLVRRCGIRWLPRSVKALDATSQTLTLDDGSQVHYDWLSINTGPVQNRSQLEISLPGARQFGLFVRPLEVFCKLWPKVVELGDQRALRIAIIGAGAAGAEIAMAIRHRLPNAAVTLLSGNDAVAASYPAEVQRLLLSRLKSMNVTVLQDVALELTNGSVRLGCGAQLACDVPVIATGAQAPTWLSGSGLKLDGRGFIGVDEFQRSISHPQVFAAGDVSTRTDRNVARSGVYATLAGPPLAANLAAAVTGSDLQAHEPPVHTFNLLTCGDRSAIGNWGAYSAQGRWVWWLKNLLDRRWIRRFRDE